MHVGVPENVLRDGLAWLDRLLAALGREGLPRPQASAWKCDDLPRGPDASLAPDASLDLEWPTWFDDEGDPWAVVVHREYWGEASLAQRELRWGVAAARRGPKVVAVSACRGPKFGHGVLAWDESQPGVGDTVALVVTWLRDKYGASATSAVHGN